MSSNMMVPFEAPGGLPAHITSIPGISEDDLISGTGGGFPVISIKGKVFHTVRGDERTLVMRSDGEPAGSIEVVILKANPALSKTYYPKGFEEGVAEKPTCYSNDGIAPAADAAEQQSVKCATCAHNQWGSKVSDSGSKVKACSDFRRLAVAPIGMLNDPMLLRVPAASLKTLGEYGNALKKRGVKYPAVVTKVGFDHSVAHPALTFKPVSFITEEMAKVVSEQMRSDLVTQICGLNAAPLRVEGQTTANADEPRNPERGAAAAAPKAAVVAETATPAPAPKPTPKKGNGKAAVFESGEAAKPGIQTQQKSQVVEVDTGNLEADLDRVLSAAGFDDK